MEPNVQLDVAQFNSNIAEYGLEAAVSWLSQYPTTIHKDLMDAFGWHATKEGDKYWENVYNNRGKNNTTSQPTPTAPKESNKPLPFEEEIQRRIDARKIVNAKNVAIHEKALELAEASRKKLEKKLKKLLAEEGVDGMEDDTDFVPF